jgi:hypothetical protein
MSDKNSRYFTWSSTYVLIISHSFLLRMRNVSGKNHTFYIQLLFFSLENRSVYETKWKNMLQPDRLQMTIWRTRFTCWITEATKTHSEYVILIAFHRNNGYTNDSPCYVIRTLPVFKFYDSWSRASLYIQISRPTDATSIYMCITLHVSSVKRSSSGVPGTVL